APLTGADIIKRYQDADVVDAAAKAKAADETKARAAAPDPYSQLPTDPAVLAPNTGAPTLQGVRNLLDNPQYVYGAPSEAVPGTALAPASAIVANLFSPFAHDRTTGEAHLALPNVVRQPLLGAIDIARGDFGTIDPSGNPLSVRPTPEALAFAGLAASPVRLGTGTPVPPSLSAREAPLSPEFTAKPVDALTDRPGATMPPGPTESNPYAAGVTPPIPAPPATSAAAKAIASGFYKTAELNNAEITPQSANSFYDKIAEKQPQTEHGQATGGTDDATALIDRWQNLRDKPISVKAAQEMDEQLGDLVDKHFDKINGLDKEGYKLQDIQQSLRDHIANLGPDDVTGGSAGFDALVQARKAYSQAMKMRDLERIQTRADMTDNPATSVKTQVRTLLTNPGKLRGYAPDEVAALQDASQRGVIGGALHVFGGRLAPLFVGAAEGSTGAGLFPTVATTLGAHVITSKMRDAASYLQQQRLANALETVGRGVPQPPGPGSMLMPPGVSPATALPGPRAIPRNLLLPPPIIPRPDQQQSQ
ncbi:MAG: hypothetical protein WBG10_15870, partial [Pseudolabrys sp.]